MQLPSHVAHFERLMYLFIGFGLLRTGLQIGQCKLADDAGNLLFWLVLLAAWVWMVLAWVRVIVAGRNWARWLLLLLALAAWGMIAFAVLIDPPVIESGVVALGAIQNSVQLVAVWLIFTGDARNWFGPSRIVVAG